MSHFEKVFWSRNKVYSRIHGCRREEGGHQRGHVKDLRIAEQWQINK